MALPEHVTPVRPGHELNEPQLLAYLSDRLEGLGSQLSLHQFKGGQSNPTYLLSAGDRQWVLRKKPHGPLLPSAHQVEREFRVIQALADTQVPVPHAHLLCEDPEVIGTTFYVMDYLPGRIFHAPHLPDAPTDQRAAMYDSMAQTLAALHAVDLEKVGLSDFGKMGQYIDRQVARWCKQYRASATAEVASMESLMQWLPENIPAGDETTLAHGDYRPGNLLFHPTEPRVIGVLDWELATLGHPLADLGYFCVAYHLPNMSRELGGLVGMDLQALNIPSQADFLTRYCEYAGRPAPERFSYFVGFSLFRLAAILQGVYQRSLQGNASDERAGMYGMAATMLADLAWQTVNEGS